MIATREAFVRALVIGTLEATEAFRMALEGPRIWGTSPLPPKDETPLARALRLAREVEELLEETSSSATPADTSAHSTRIARAMAAGLVDELKNLELSDRKPRLC
ncbi:MAG: hypothetical protein U0270_39190 [Labilithrix sp.]